MDAARRGLPTARPETRRMIFGIGTDVVQLERIEAVYARHGEHFVRRLLMPEEEAAFRAYKRPVRFLAMRFAAKEAIVKALGTGFAHGIWIRDVGIAPNAWGRPEVIWSERGPRAPRPARRRRRARHAHGRGGPRGRGGRADEATGEQLSDASATSSRSTSRPSPTSSSAAALHGLEGLSDKQVGYVMQTRQREQTGSEFLSLEQQRIVAISVAMRTRDGFKVWSLGETDSSPRTNWCAASSTASSASAPTLVSWNGSGFDLPVLHYRALRHRVQAHRYWEMGDEDQSFRWNNYLSRFHWRHVDLMDVLSGFQGRGRVGLDQHGAAARASRQARHDRARASGTRTSRAAAEDIRNYCETDVINTYLIYLRFELLRGRLTPRRARPRVRARARVAAGSRKAAPAEFLAAWPTTELQRMKRLQRRARGGGHRRSHARGRGRRAHRRQDGVRRRRAAGRARGPASDATAPQVRRGGRWSRCCAPAPTACQPQCPHFGLCGGCALQHLAPAAQLAFKQAQLLENLARLGEVEPGRLLEPLTGPGLGLSPARATRRQARADARAGCWSVSASAPSPYVADLHECHVLVPPVGALIDPLAELVAGALHRSARAAGRSRGRGRRMRAGAARARSADTGRPRTAARVRARARACASTCSRAARTVMAPLSARCTAPLHYSLPALRPAPSSSSPPTSSRSTAH